MLEDAITLLQIVKNKVSTTRRTFIKLLCVHEMGFSTIIKSNNCRGLWDEASYGFVYLFSGIHQ